MKRFQIGQLARANAQRLGTTFAIVLTCSALISCIPDGEDGIFAAFGYGYVGAPEMGYDGDVVWDGTGDLLIEGMVRTVGQRAYLTQIYAASPAAPSNTVRNLGWSSAATAYDPYPRWAYRLTRAALTEAFCRIPRGSPTNTVNIAATVGSRRAVVWQPAVRGDLHVTIRATNPVDCEGILFATSTTFYDVDSLGSPIAATDEAGAVLWRGEYTPFGAPLRNQSAAEIGFTGGRQDPVVGLVDLGHRQYQPEIGRFYGMDPIGMREDDPASFNRYAYGNNSPQRFVDPNGAIPLETLWDAANVMIGVGSFTYNVSEGNVGSAVIDAVGIVVDVAATIVPYVPGGLGTIIKATRTADAALDAATAVPQLGRKLDYLFGLATGAAHNIERSTTMMGQLNRIGLNDTPASRRLVTEHLTDVFNDPSTIRAVQDNGRVVRESLLSGPGGNLKMESIWEGDRLITMNLFGGR